MLSFRDVALLLALATGSVALAADAHYVIVVAEGTRADPAWQPVVAALQQKHGGEVLTYSASIDDVAAALSERMPRFTCFVAKPEDASRELVASVHMLTRKLDDDPYTDTRWGILTGYDAANALAIAKQAEPLTVHKVASGTEIAIDMCDEADWHCELTAGKSVHKSRDGKVDEQTGDADSTAALVGLLNEEPDLFVTSGHATERNWQIGFRYRNGYFQSHAGQMIGLDTQGKTYEIDSPNPKVYLPIGNCLMGHIDGPDAMALAWMNDAGVKQMIGYTVPTWFGYAGWGCLDYFVEQPGRYTLNEAFLANQHALDYALQIGKGNRQGLEHDRTVVAFYGDPAWEARMAERHCYYDQELTQSGNEYTLTITPQRGDASLAPVNTNGSERGGRPIFAYLPHRIGTATITEGADLSPVVTDDFVLVPNPGKVEAGRAYVVKFRAEPL